jgi:hypothetical protein
MRAACSRRFRGRHPGRPGHPRVPAGHGCSRPRRDLRRPDPARCLDPGRSRPGVLGRLRQRSKGAATNAVELAELLVERGWVAPAARRGSRATATGSPAAGNGSSADGQAQPGDGVPVAGARV